MRQLPLIEDQKSTTAPLARRQARAGYSALTGSLPLVFHPAPSDETALELVRQGALVVVNHSGGKDSQALLLKIRALVPSDQILVIHAHLPEVEWAETEEWARYSARGLAFVTVQAGKTFLGMVESRGQWPSPKYRQCTSDLKRGPIEKAIRAWVRDHGLSGVVINAMGLRAAESSNRSKLEPWKEDKGKATTRGAIRRWFDWLPIHGYSTPEVFEAIAQSGERHHWAYDIGMTRLSCAFCIMSSKEDLRIAAKARPDLYARYVELEKKIGKTVFLGKGNTPVPLEQMTGIKAKRFLPVLR